ncbi:threonine synthase [Tistlia consotensis]|uniref:Threonine synthase n=1 Tax=Tistlia consotensis USBA 355 TaxID=560819 RepID=A0A1Y6C7Q1_9PROT|nr:pyridoxal-phosphate dependent enzyme [Tistlia consotensis]SMF47455.1 threonine synthase [Tistlia consotensis USBA 355]SNR82472.1 threonine synthase [Tistlia consotensis]
MSARRPLDRIAGYACLRCGARQPLSQAVDYASGCPRCRDEAPAPFAVAYTERALAGRRWPEHRLGGGLWRYEGFLPLRAGDAVMLGEGDTPLVAAGRYGGSIGIDGLFIKDESRNPTWSHKDRFSTVAVSYARTTGAAVLATSSSGNAGASLAAYAAKAGVPCIVLTFAGTAGAMAAQIRKYGALLVPLADKAERWPVLAEGVRRQGWFAASPYRAPVVGSHPVGVEGYKTIAYETFEQLGRRVPDWFAVPTAYGDMLAGIWQGFLDLRDAGLSDGLPRLVAAEVYGSLAHTLARGGDRPAAMDRRFDTDALSIGTLQGSFQALNALRRSNGVAVPVTDDEIFEAQDALAYREGLFGELSSVAPLAALARLRKAGTIRPGDRVVGLVSASGLKDLDRSARHVAPLPPATGGFEGVMGYLADHYRFPAPAEGPGGNDQQSRERRRA